MGVKENLENLKSELSEDITLVAVSKTKPLEDILDAYNAGHRDFGENKIQELEEKYQQLPKDINWHMIGHVQRNKVKYIAEFIHLIHGVDSLKLLKEIDKRAKQQQRVIDCLLQIKIAKEDSKFGMTMKSALEMLRSEDFKALKNISIIGLMGMATFTDDKKMIREEFQRLNSFFEEIIQNQILSDRFKVLSMGMSDDYEIALDYGSNMIRVGSRIFGKRNY